MAMQRRTDTQSHTKTDTQTRVTSIHFASSTTAKCNERPQPASFADSFVACDLSNYRIVGPSLMTVSDLEAYLNTI